MLEKLYQEFYVPAAVFEKIAQAEKTFAKELKLFLHGKIKNVENKLAVEMLSNDIGACWRGGGNSLGFGAATLCRPD